MKIAIVCAVVLLAACSQESAVDVKAKTDHYNAEKRARGLREWSNRIAHAKACRKQCDATSLVVARFEYKALRGASDCVCGTPGVQVPSESATVVSQGSNGDFATGVMTGVVVSGAMRPSRPAPVSRVRK